MLDSLCRLSPVLAALVLALMMAGSAAAQIPPPVDEPCGELTRQCAQMTDAELYATAFLTGTGSSLGTCYVHDTSTCPGCACPYYVKLSWEDGDKGFDGGTGCVQSLDEAIAVLRSLCATGQCGCPAPIEEEKPVPCTAVVVWAKDSITGTCCQYGDPCSAPASWQIFYTPEDCENA